MTTHADRTQENKGRSVANAVSQKQGGGKSTFQFVDNRPEAIPQRKLQEIAGSSPRATQLRALRDISNNSPQGKKATQLQAMTDNYSAKHQQSIQKINSNGNTIQRELKVEQLKQTDSSANGIRQTLIYLLEQIIECPDPKEERGKQALEKWEQAQDLAERAKQIAEDPIGETTKLAAKEYWNSLTPVEKAEVVGKAIMQGAKGLVTLLQNIRISLPDAGGDGGQSYEGQGGVNLSFDNLGSFDINKKDLDLLSDFLRARHEFNKQKAKAEEEVERGKSWIKGQVEKGIHSVGKGVGSREAEANRGILKNSSAKTILALQASYDELKAELKGHENVNDRYDELFALFDPLLLNLITQPLAYINLPQGKLGGAGRTQLKSAAVMYLALLKSASIRIPAKEVAMDIATGAKKTISSGLSAIKDKLFGSSAK